MDKFLSETKYNEIAHKVARGESIDNTTMYQFQRDTETIKREEIQKKYKLTKKEITALETAMNPYEYEDNEGTIFRDINEIWGCFDTTPTDTIKKAFAEYIIAHDQVFNSIWDNRAITLINEFQKGGE